jgi:hypothetical protein
MVLYNYNATIKEVHSGDSFTAIIDLGFGKKVEKEMKLMFVVAPSLKTIKTVVGEEEKVIPNPAWTASTNKLTELIKGKDVVLETYKVKNDYLARITIEGMQWPINDYMVRYGLAKTKR